MPKTSFDYIICGGGASGLLFAKALCEDPFFSSHSILLIDKATKTTNDRTWCYWEIGEGSFDSLLETQWDNAIFKSHGFKTQFALHPYRYKMLRSEKFYASVQQVLQKNQCLHQIKAEVTDIQSQAEEVRVSTPEGVYLGKQVFNSIFNPKELLQQQKYPVLQQHFVGWFVKTQQPHFSSDTLTFMDFDIPQESATRFLYVLPLDAHTALVEYTLFSESLLTTEAYETGIKNYLSQLGITAYELLEKEQGAIPMSCFPFEKANTHNLLHIGTAGGWTKASTGFTFQKSHQQVQRLLPFLKRGKPLSRFAKRNRFWFYDLLFLDVLQRKNEKGGLLFQKMFEKNTPKTIFRFLNESTHLGEELRILSSFPIGWFVKALIKRLF